MLKSVVLCILVWHEMCEFSSHGESCCTDTPIKNFSASVIPKVNNTDMQTEPRVIRYHFEHNFHMNGSDNVSRTGPPRDEGNRRLEGASPQAQPNQSEPTYASLIRPGPGYIVTDEIGTYKRHYEWRTWEQARQICISEGGDLPVIRSISEEKIVRKMFSVEEESRIFWIGYDKQFSRRGWTSHGPLSYGFRCEDLISQRSACPIMWISGTGMSCIGCRSVMPFVCKIRTF